MEHDQASCVQQLAHSDMSMTCEQANIGNGVLIIMEQEKACLLTVIKAHVDIYRIGQGILCIYQTSTEIHHLCILWLYMHACSDVHVL